MYGVCKVFCVIPNGPKNSSISISPGCVGSLCVGTLIITNLQFLMIVYNFNLIWAIIRPNEANAKLIVDSNAMLTMAITLESFKQVAWRYF